MRLKLPSNKKQLSGLLLNGKESSEPADIIHAASFVLRRALIVLGIGIPVLYITHLILLSVYSRILSTENHNQYSSSGHRPNHGPSSIHQQLKQDPPEHAHILPPPPDTNRTNDVSNTFLTYANAERCGISSLDLHLPIHPSCDSHDSVMNAMSYGGRAGFDQPFIPFGCDFRWYSTEEMCSIISRFSHIYIIGDSLQRMIVTALYVLLRKDLGLGGVGEWDFKPSEKQGNDTIQKLSDCTCEHQFDRHECSHSPILRYTDALKRSSSSPKPACGSIPSTDPTDHPFDISYHEIQKYPATEAEVADVLAAVPSSSRPPKPPVVIMHHTFWNDVNLTATVAWVDQLTEALNNKYTYLPQPNSFGHLAQGTHGFPRLFVTANAAGVMKNSAYLDTQNSIAIARFEQELKPHMTFRNVELLGFYNMSVQTTSSDGTHANMRTNLVKAMMVLNWLDWVGKEEGGVWDKGGA